MHFNLKFGLTAPLQPESIPGTARALLDDVNENQDKICEV
jgi:hypothetical protein